jgi:hypothetical protein
LLTAAESLERELLGHWDLTREGLGFAGALAARVAVATASATLGAAHRERIAARLRSSPLFGEDPR